MSEKQPQPSGGIQGCRSHTKSERLYCKTTGRVFPVSSTKATETNDDMPYFVVSEVEGAASRQGICTSRAKVLFLGTSFKEDVGDLSNSPAPKVKRILNEKVSGWYTRPPHRRD